MVSQACPRDRSYHHYRLIYFHWVAKIHFLMNRRLLLLRHRAQLFKKGAWLLHSNRLHQTDVIAVRVQVRQIDVVCSSLRGRLSIQTEAMNAARFAPQGAPFFGWTRRHLFLTLDRKSNLTFHVSVLVPGSTIPERWCTTIALPIRATGSSVFWVD